MTETNYLCDLWQHSIVKIFKHDLKSELGLMIKQWLIFNKLEYFNSILNYSISYSPSLTNLAAQTEFSQPQKDCSGSAKDSHGL